MRDARSVGQRWRRGGPPAPRQQLPVLPADPGIVPVALLLCHGCLCLNVCEQMYDPDADRTEFLVFDARRVNDGPV